MRVTMAVVLMCCFPPSAFAAGPPQAEEDELAPLIPVVPLTPAPHKMKKKAQPAIPAAPKPQKLQAEDEDLAPLPSDLPQKRTEKDPLVDEEVPRLEMPPLAPFKAAKKAKKCDPKKEGCKKEEEILPDLVDLPLAPLEPAQPTQEVRPQKKLVPPVSPTEPPVAVVTAKPPDRNWAPTIGGIVGLGLGAGAMGFGIYYGVQAQDAYNKAPNAPTHQEFENLRRSVKTNSTFADVSFVIGGIMLAGGATVVIIDNLVWNKDQDVEKKVSLGVTGNGAVLMGTW